MSAARPSSTQAPSSAQGSVPPQQKRSIIEVIHNLQQTIQSYGPGPHSDEQSRELEKLNSLFAKAKLEYEKQVKLLQAASMVSSQQQQQQQQQQQLQQLQHQAQQQQQPQQQLYHVTVASTSQPEVRTHAGSTTIPNIAQPVVQQAATIAQVQQQGIVVGGQKVTTYTTPTGQTIQIPTQGIQVSSVAGTALQTAVPVQQLQSTVSVSQLSSMIPQSNTTQGTSATIQPATIPGAVQANTPALLMQHQQQQQQIQIQQQQKPSVSPTPKRSIAQGLGRGDLASAVQPGSQLLPKRKLQDLLQEIDPLETMDEDVEEALLQIADDFIDSVVTASCQLAKHRKSNTLDVKDIQLHLDRSWNMWVPGFGSEDLRPQKKLPSTDAHRQRLALIKKSLKK